MNQGCYKGSKSQQHDHLGLVDWNMWLIISSPPPLEQDVIPKQQPQEDFNLERIFQFPHEPVGTVTRHWTNSHLQLSNELYSSSAFSSTALTTFFSSFHCSVVSPHDVLLERALSQLDSLTHLIGICLEKIILSIQPRKLRSQRGIIQSGTLP